MAKCETCKFDNVCDFSGTFRNNVRECRTYEQKEQQTWGNKIRAMSDEELAELFTQYSCEDADYTSLLPIEECKWGTKQEVINRNLKWLKSEAKE